MTKTSTARILHYLLLFTLALFTLAAIGLGEILNAYEAVWWWDDMLHGVSGVLMGLVGLLTIYLFNARHTMAISPSFVAVFVFCFAMTIGVLWEIFEFGMDFFFGTTMQQWDISSNAIIMGKDYQGIGLRDTMADLIVTCVGAIVASILAYFAYRHERSTVLGVMRRTFPWIRRRAKKDKKPA